MKGSVIIVGLCIFVLLTVPTTVFSEVINDKGTYDIPFFETIGGTHGQKAIKTDLSFNQIYKDQKSLGTDTQITFSEFDEGHPVIDIDYNGNPVIVYHSIEDFTTSKIFVQRSMDGGLTWPEDYGGYWEWEDRTTINPDIDFTDGIRAFGTYETAEQEPFLYFFDYVDIDDPASWMPYYFDYSTYTYYIAETAVAANKSGRIAFGTIRDYQGDDYFEDTLFISWDANNLDDDYLDGGVYWLNKDDEGNTIPYSHLSGDAGDKIFFVFQRETPDGMKQICSAFCRVDENTVYSDWRWYFVARSSNYNNTFPDISVSGNKAYITYMCDKNGQQDIFVATSTTGSFWGRYQVTDTVDDELYPVISADGDKATILFIKNGNLYKTITEDAGQTWNIPELVNDEHNTVVEEFQNLDIKKIYGIWTDNRNGNDDIYFEDVGAAPILRIDDIQGGFGIQSTLSNVGNAPAEHVEWGIYIEGGIILAGRHTNGTVTLLPDDTITVKTGLVFGLGRVSIIVRFGDITKTSSGFVLGPFVLDVT